MFNTVAEIREANDKGGFYFFSPETMRFFNSRVLPGVYHDTANERTLFVTSERFEEEPRRYTLRYAALNGDVGTLGDHQQYATLKEARQAARDASDAAYTWIMYMHFNGPSFQLYRVPDLVTVKAIMNANDYFNGQGVSASLYPYTGQDWREAVDFEDTGCPFDYPTKVVERGPRGGLKVSNV